MMTILWIFQPAEHGELRGEPGDRGAEVDADRLLQDRSKLRQDQGEL